MVETNAISSAKTSIPAQAYAITLIGLVAVSLAAIFIRFAQNEGIPSLLIAASRLTIAALVLTPITLRRHLAELQQLRRIDFMLAAFSGLWLATHFATWITSLEHTTVLVSTVLVTSTPLWAGVLEWIVFKARLSRLVLIGLVVAIVGGLLIALPSEGGISLGSSPVAGAFLALSAALAMAIYLIIGRKLRAGLSLIPYIWLVYSCAAIILIIVIAVARIPVIGYNTEGYLWLLTLGLVPQLIGHSSFNYALKYLPATFISIAGQMESVGSAIAAFFLFQEIPGLIQMIGSIIILMGVAFASLGQLKPDGK